ncbi:class I SAM-dependent methyltransferase [Streptomyces sp. BK79]|uniref:class I SAM-dependent methyltransferase n=1 Tax=Streptomyces sp. BK79 TaxID=3350097 RepID=UPI00376FDCDA
MSESSPNIGSVFDEGAEGFTAWTPLLWDPIGAATVERVGVRPGDRVLDVCCGNGSAALPAGRAVGPDGWVDGVDLAERLLLAARDRADRADLTRLRFHTADATAWTAPDGRPYTVLVCVFGVFFLPDMDRSAARLLRQLTPGGRAAFTVWSEGSMDPLVKPFAEAATAELEAAGRPAPLPSAAMKASRRLGTPERLRDWMSGLDVTDVAVHPLELTIPVSPELAWQFVTGAGPRMLLAGLGSDAVSRVRDRYFDQLARSEVDAFHARALVATGSRPA